MERMQAKGEIPEAELKALEMDMTGKVRPKTKGFCDNYALLIYGDA